MRYFSLLISVLIITSCSFSSDKIDYDFSSEILFLNKEALNRISSIEIYFFSKSEAKYLIFGVKNSTEKYKPIKVINEYEARKKLSLLSDNTGSKKGCNKILSNDSYHFVIRLKNSEEVGYFLARPCSNNLNTVKLSYFLSNGAKGIAYSESLYELISQIQYGK